MNLATITEDEFLCADSVTVTGDQPLAFEMASPLFEQMVGVEIGSLGNGYRLHRLGDTPGDVALLKESKFVGFYHGESLAIHPSERGKGLSTPLVLQAVVSRDLPTKRILSTAGQSALRRAWRVANDKEPNLWPIIEE